MTHERDIERLLDLWMIDGPTEVADRVVLEAADRIDRQPQRPAWRLLRRPTPMNGSLRWIAAAAAVLLIAVVGFVVLGQQPPSGVGGAPATPSPSPAPPRSGPVFDPRHPSPLPLSAGIHSTYTFRPTVTFELTNDWVHYGDYPEVFMFSPDTAANRALEEAGSYPSNIDMYSGPLTAIPDLPLAGPPTDETACAWDRPGAAPLTGTEVVMNATGFVDYLASQDGFAKTGPIPVTVGGLTGQQITLVPEAGWTTCLPTTGIAEAVTARTEGYRYIVLDTPGGGTLEIILFAPSDFDAFAAEAMPVVESFEFDLSQLPSPSP